MEVMQTDSKQWYISCHRISSAWFNWLLKKYWCEQDLGPPHSGFQRLYLQLFVSPSLTRSITKSGVMDHACKLYIHSSLTLRTCPFVYMELKWCIGLHYTPRFYNIIPMSVVSKGRDGKNIDWMTEKLRLTFGKHKTKDSLHHSAFHPPSVFYRMRKVGYSWEQSVTTAQPRYKYCSTSRKPGCFTSNQCESHSVTDSCFWWCLNLYFCLCEQALVPDILVSRFSTFCYSKQNPKLRIRADLRAQHVVSVIHFINPNWVSSRFNWHYSQKFRDVWISGNTYIKCKRFILHWYYIIKV